MYCINKSHPEYINLLENTKDHPHILNYKINVWMNHNGNNNFPTLEELSVIPVKAKTYFSTNPIRDLGVKYFSNSKGFMPANINLADLRRDSRKLNLTVHKSYRDTYYLKNNKNQFVNPTIYRQIDSQSSILPYKDLTDKLLSWAENHGISVITMEEMINRATEADPIRGSVAVADLLNNIIALDPEKEMSDTFAEEVSHFATAILKDDTSVKKAMDMIDKTDLYKRVKEDYADLYDKEEDFRKEAVDKLLAQAIIENFKDTTENTGILAYIKGIWSKFKKWLNKFKKSSAVDQIKKELYPLSQKILENEYLGENTSLSDTIFHQKDFKAKKKQPPFTEEQKEEILKKVEDSTEKVKGRFAIKMANILHNRLIQLQQRSVKAKKIKNLDRQIQVLRDSIKGYAFTEGVMGIIEHTRTELEAIEKIVKKQLDNDYVNQNNTDDVSKFINTNVRLFNEFSSQLRQMGFKEEEESSIRDSINNIVAELIRVGVDNDVLVERGAFEIQTAANTAPDGSKIDSDFDPKEISSFSKKDTNYWRLWMGNWKHAASGIIRSVHKLIFDAGQSVNRHGVEVANELMVANTLLEKAGYKQSDLIETDSKGKSTQFLIRAENWSEYYEKFDEFKTQLAISLGFENFNEIDFNTLSKEQLKKINKAKAQFHKINSITVYDEEGNFLSRKPKKKNPRFAELMKNEDVKNFYDLLIETRKADLSKLPSQYRTETGIYLRPGIRTQFLEKLLDRRQSFLTNISAVADEAFFIDEDDTEFGEVTALGNRMVPIYFTQRFENPGNVSNDLVRSYTVFSKMAENFKQMGTIAAPLENLLTQVGKREYKSLRGKKKGLASREYKALETLIEAGVYGIQNNDITLPAIGENKVTKKLKIAGKTISLSKIARKFASYMSVNNLGLNIFTSNAGLLKGTIDARIEAKIGLYTTTESNLWARGEYYKNIPHVLSQAFAKKQTNKLQLLLQRYGIIGLDHILQNTNRNRLLSTFTSKDALFLNFRVADYAIKGKVLLNILDNTRLVDGKFMTRKNFLEKRAKEGVNEKEARKEWKNYRDKSLYNAYEVEGKNLKIKEDWKQYVTEDMENSTTGKINHVANMVDGKLSESDKGALSRILHQENIFGKRYGKREILILLVYIDNGIVLTLL